MIMRIVERALMRAAWVLVLLLVLNVAAGVAVAAPKRVAAKSASRPKATPAKTEGLALESKVRKELEAVRVGKPWRHIVIHHTATPAATAKGIDRFHREQR